MNALKNLTSRERLIVSFALIALIGLSFHALVWQPLMDDNVALLDQVEEANSDLQWIQQNVVGLNKSNITSTKAISGSLVSWLDLRIKRYKLKPQLKRIKPTNNKQVKVWFEQADIGQLVRLLGDMKQYQVEIKEVKINATSIVGHVDANVILKRL